MFYKTDDTITRKYIFNKGLSYFEKGKFKDTYNLGLIEEEYKFLNLTFYVISRNNGQVKKTNYEDALQENEEESIIILDCCDNHLIFSRLN